jgi:hypothetical protein
MQVPDNHAFFFHKPEEVIVHLRKDLAGKQLMDQVCFFPHIDNPDIDLLFFRTRWAGAVLLIAAHRKHVLWPAATTAATSAFSPSPAGTVADYAVRIVVCRPAMPAPVSAAGR